MPRQVFGLLAIGIVALALTQNSRAGDSVKGQVVFKGAIPPQKVVPGQPPPENLVIDPTTRGLKNVVVFLVDPENPLKPIPHPNMKEIQARPFVLDQSGQRFTPHIVVLVGGQNLEVKNSDTVAHSPILVSSIPNPTNYWENMVPGQSINVSGWKATGKVSVVTCAVCPWMKAYIWAMPSPYYAVTDKDGTFEIKDVPPGKYKIVYWHESTGWRGKGKTKAGDDLEVKPGGADVGKVD